MKWVLAESDDRDVTLLSEQTGLHPLIARLLANRSITDPAAAQTFLACDLAALSDPALFTQMGKAVSRIRAAIANRSRIIIFGDYDVDGVTGASLLYLTLKDMGADVGCYIPDRITEGYGLNAHALQKIKEAGAGLVITVDCGISNTRQAELARSLGLDLIITDHHELIDPKSELLEPKENEAAAKCGIRDAGCGFVLPDASAILHPELISPETPSSLRSAVGVLTGVGVVFKLAQALMELHAEDGHLLRYLDLVTLGTLADVGRVTGENRILVKHGLQLLSSDTGPQRPGIAALMKVSGLDGKAIGVGAIGFTIAPRINASGRLESADTAFRLLTTSSPEEAGKLASALDAVNRERQYVEEAIWGEARRLCMQTDRSAAGALVLSSAEWHPGVIGIVASRIVDEFYRPTALISLKDGVGKGSARSIPGFDLYHGLVECADLLMGFGGHTYAAGFTIAEENIPRFREKLSCLVQQQFGAAGAVRTLSIDSAVTLDVLTMNLMQQIEKLAPFGQGNPEPRLGARGLEVVSARVVGNNHLKLRLRQRDGTALDAIAFNRGTLLGKQVKDGARLAAVFTPRINAWNGKTAVELEIRDLKTER
ncbi:MAG TPA: DHH family phosphoesterase [Nitrospirota bacterium]|nr:DHH family phosphoesterase [Nitrospirota bacterium]